MNERGPTPADVFRSKETENSDSFSGLHARLLLADRDYFDSEKNFPLNKERKVSSLEERDYGHYERVSQMDRKRFWSQREEVDNKYTLWAEQVVDAVKKLDEEKRKKIYDPLFAQIGIKKDESDTNFTAKDANILHDHYFSKKYPKDPENPKKSEKEKSNDEMGVKQFVKDVFKAHGPDLSEDKIREIKKFAGIFGEESVDMIEHLILAEAKLIKDGNFVDGVQIEKINSLSQKERKIINQIHEAREEERIKNKEALEAKLPIMQYRDTVRQQLEDEDTILLIGGTGCGKTVGFPYMVRELMDEERDQGKNPGKFFITEPTIINTESLAEKIAGDSAVTLGHEVDYKHSGKKGYNEDANTVLMTQMTLIRKFLDNDPEIRNLTRLMIDEAHALSTDTILLMALAKKEQQRRREARERGSNEPPLKLYVASATIDEKKFRKYLGLEEENKKTLNIPGTIQDITEKFAETPSDQKHLPQEISKKVEEIIKSDEGGDIMIFVAGNEDIRMTIDEINKTLKANSLNKDHRYIDPMGLSRDSSTYVKKEATKLRTDGKRRIIVSTNFAETGITIQGLKHVIDTGLRKEMKYNHQLGMQQLETTKASRDECMQRRGRVGRVEPGKWYPLYTQDDFAYEKDNDGIEERECHSTEMTGEKRPVHIVPEIQKTDLTNTILLLKKYGMDIKRFKSENLLFEEPDPEILEEVENSLVALKALDENKKITPLGREMEGLRLDKAGKKFDDIHYKRMISDAKLYHKDQLGDICALLALMDGSLYKSDEKDRSVKEKAREAFKLNAEEFVDNSSDFITWLKVWEKFNSITDKKQQEEWADNLGLNIDGLRETQHKIDRIYKVAKGIKDEKSNKKIEIPLSNDYDKIKSIIKDAYADRFMERIDQSYVREGYISKPDDLNLLLGNQSMVDEKSLDKNDRLLFGGVFVKNDKNVGYLSPAQVV